LELKSTGANLENEIKRCQSERWKEVMENMGYEVNQMDTDQIQMEMRKILNCHMLEFEWFIEYKRDETNHYAEL